VSTQLVSGQLVSEQLMSVQLSSGQLANKQSSTDLYAYPISNEDRYVYSYGVDAISLCVPN
jgi:hypothetical protein